ncbi:hypothetical protein GMW39_14730 [Pectobacterium parmentieri]|nr:hypothetical protein [Pectobacterium parmentieri]QHQ16984.1 hypothetical protein GMW39_14730 [Pectobacterium parmentieri]
MSNQNIELIKEFKDVAKVFMPVIALFIGTFLGFGVEAIKSSRKRKAELSAVKNEMNDELIILQDNLVRMCSVMSNLELYIRNVTNKNEIGIFKSKEKSLTFIPIKIDLMIMEKNFESFYVSAKKDFRHKLKVILHLKNVINKYLDEIRVLAYKENDRKKETNDGNDVVLRKEILEYKKRYIYTTCCMIYNINSCLNNNFPLSKDCDSDSIVKYQLDKLNILLSPDDVKIKRTEKINLQ